MNLKYFFGSLVVIPLLPLMYFQGKRIKASVPKLPEASGNEGIASVNAKKKLNVLTIGESTIAGVGVETHQEGFSGTLAQEIALETNANVHWRVYAKSGYNAAKVKDKIVPQIQEHSVDLIVVGLGGNDAFELNSPGKWRRQMSALIVSLRAKFPDTPIVFANMPPIKEFPAFTPLIKFAVGNLVEIFGEELNKLMRNHHKVFYNAEVLIVENWIKRLKVKASPADFFSDGVHPSKLTYQVWARDLTGFLMKQNEIRDQLTQ